jgi:Gas vesicle protein
MNDGNDRPVVRDRAASAQNRHLATPAQPTNLADLLERVLDKGIVVAGDITLALGTVDILTLKIRLLIASVDKAQEIGINWWQSDPALSSQAQALIEERDQLKERIQRLEGRLGIESKEPEQQGEQAPAEQERSRSDTNANLP